MRDWLPVDLLAVGGTVIAVPVAVLLLGTGGHLGQVVVGAVFVLVAPGYALVSVLLPATGLETATGDYRGGQTDVSIYERTLLAVGLSIALVPAVGIVLHYTPPGLGAEPYLLVLGGGTLLLTVWAAVRRARVQPRRRFSIDPTGVSGRLGALVSGAESDGEARLNVIFVSGLVIAVVGFGTAVAVSGPGEQFTEFHVQTEDPESGAVTADEYPSEMVRGEESKFVVGITNQEHQSREYTVVVELQRLEGGEVVGKSKLGQFTQTLAHNETVQERVTVAPDVVGENLRLSYQLYLGTPPDEPAVDAAYRHVYLWVDVSRPQ